MSLLFLRVSTEVSHSVLLSQPTGWSGESKTAYCQCLLLWWAWLEGWSQLAPPVRVPTCHLSRTDRLFTGFRSQEAEAASLLIQPWKPRNTISTATNFSSKLAHPTFKGRGVKVYHSVGGAAKTFCHNVGLLPWFI